jgi:hypothetical protein
MKFEWKMLRDSDISFEDKVHNLACFEIVLNILRMKTKAGDEDISDEMQALCGFALECMFGDMDLRDEDLFDTIMSLKDKKVHKFRATLLRDMGVPESIMDSPEIGEA